MKYLITYLLSCIIYLLFLFPVYAQWIKYPQNPVLKATPNTWYSIHATGPHVIYDGGLFKMWFQGHDGSTFKIGSAYSSDGVNWNISSQPQITVSSPGLANGYEVVEPMVIKNASNYQMWFKEYIPGENRIRYATSTDGNTWTINPQSVFTKSQESWEYTGPTNPSIIFENNEYKMWYTAAGNTSSWQMGFATSSDGINWTRNSNNPLNIPTLGFVGGPTVTKINNQYHMWYHTGNGLNTDIYHVVSSDGIQWSCDGNCSVLHIENNTFDSQGMVAPVVLEQNGKLYLWYGGSNGPNWQIGLATFELPVPQKKPVVLIPGFLASWNKDAVLHNRQVSQKDWKLTPFVKEYDGIIGTLKNIGYQENQDFFIFSYDWRKGTEALSDDLRLFVEQNILNNKPDAKINLVGHSYGGLVARIYGQKYSGSSIENIVTIGSPHQGTALVYKPIESGELDMNNSLLWLGEKFILQLYKDGVKTNKQIINERLASVKDLFPTYNFLKNSNNQEISIAAMQMKNDVLLSYNPNLPTILNSLFTIAGEKSDTLSGFKVSNRTIFDQLFDLYPDGRPSENQYQIGDAVIISNSAKAGNNPSVLPYDHGEIIYKKESIAKILDTLHIGYQNSQIVEGSQTTITPSLFFALFSPATMEVTYNSQTFSETDGIIFIPNAQSGNYTLKVSGKENGKYSLLIGQVGNQNDQWSTINGEITQTPATSQVDSYTINFNSSSPQGPLSSQSSFDECMYALTDLKKTITIPEITYAMNSFKQAAKFFQTNDKRKLKSTLLLTHSYLIAARSKTLNTSNKFKILAVLDKLENLYYVSLSGYTEGISSTKLSQSVTSYQQKTASLETVLLALKNQGKDISLRTQTLYTVRSKLQTAENQRQNNNLNYAEIMLKTVGDLLMEIQKT